MKNVSFDANADILHRVPTTIEVMMSRDPIDGGDLQRLLAKDFPKYRSRTLAPQLPRHMD